MFFYLKFKVKIFNNYCKYKSIIYVLCKYYEEWICFFFILVVNIGNDVFMFGGFVSIVFGMCFV